MPRVLNVEKLEKKFASLTRSRESIQGLSSWIMHHKEFYEEIVAEWLNCLIKDCNALTMFYVANDVIQQCGRKKAPEFREAFSTVLERAVSLEKVKEIKKEVNRLLTIWNERDIYDDDFTQFLQKKVNSIEEVTSSESEDELSETEIIASFKLRNVIEDLQNMKALEDELEQKAEILEETEEPKMPSVDNIIIRLEGQQELKKCEAFHNDIEEYISLANNIITAKKKLLRLLKNSSVFYSVQNEEVKKVAHAYRIYGKKLKMMDKNLSEKMCSLREMFPSPVQENSPCISDADFPKDFAIPGLDVSSSEPNKTCIKNESPSDILKKPSKDDREDLVYNVDLNDAGALLTMSSPSLEITEKKPTDKQLLVDESCLQSTEKQQLEKQSQKYDKNIMEAQVKVSEENMPEEYLAITEMNLFEAELELIEKKISLNQLEINEEQWLKTQSEGIPNKLPEAQCLVPDTKLSVKEVKVPEAKLLVTDTELSEKEAKVPETKPLVSKKELEVFEAKDLVSETKFSEKELELFEAKGLVSETKRSEKELKVPVAKHLESETKPAEKQLKLPESKQLAPEKKLVEKELKASEPKPAEKELKTSHIKQPEKELKAPDTNLSVKELKVPQTKLADKKLEVPDKKLKVPETKLPENRVISPQQQMCEIKKPEEQLQVTGGFKEKSTEESITERDEPKTSRGSDNSVGYSNEVDFLLEEAYDNRQSKTKANFKRKLETLLKAKGKRPCTLSDKDEGSTFSQSDQVKSYESIHEDKITSPENNNFMLAESGIEEIVESKDINCNIISAALQKSDPLPEMVKKVETIDNRLEKLSSCFLNKTNSSFLDKTEAVSKILTTSLDSNPKQLDKATTYSADVSDISSINSSTSLLCDAISSIPTTLLQNILDKSKLNSYIHAQKLPVKSNDGNPTAFETQNESHASLPKMVDTPALEGNNADFDFKNTDNQSELNSFKSNINCTGEVNIEESTFSNKTLENTGVAENVEKGSLCNDVVATSCLSNTFTEDALKLVNTYKKQNDLSVKNLFIKNTFPSSEECKASVRLDELFKSNDKRERDNCISSNKPNFLNSLKNVLELVTENVGIIDEANSSTSDDFLSSTSKIPLENSLKLYSVLSKNCQPISAQSGSNSLKDIVVHLDGESVNQSCAPQMCRAAESINDNNSHVQKNSNISNVSIKDNLDIMDMEVDSGDETLQSSSLLHTVHMSPFS